MFESVIMTAVKRRKTKQCEFCGAEFEYIHGRTKLCPECQGVIHSAGGYHTPNTWGGPKSDQEAYEKAIRANAIARAKHNENIIGKGYAERQIQNTLSMVEPIKTEL